MIFQFSYTTLIVYLQLMEFRFIPELLQVGNCSHGLLNLNCATLITAVTKLGFSMEQLIPLTSKNVPLTNSIC
jgi:hypothetical protein